MAKKRVQLYLDGDTYNAAQELIKALPGSPALSTLVDGYLGFIVTTMATLLDSAKAGDAATTLAMVNSIYSDLVVQQSQEFSQLRDTLREKVIHTTTAGEAPDPVDG